MSAIVHSWYPGTQQVSTMIDDDGVPRLFHSTSHGVHGVATQHSTTVHPVPGEGQGLVSPQKPLEDVIITEKKMVHGGTPIPYILF